MSYLHNQESTSRARSLRQKQTEPERYLWSRLRGKRLLGYKFYRQYPIGKYIVDFYCPEKKLVVELDGSQHLMMKEYDTTRTSYLNSKGIAVIRFWDNDVLKEVQKVLEEISRKLN